MFATFENLSSPTLFIVLLPKYTQHVRAVNTTFRWVPASKLDYVYTRELERWKLNQLNRRRLSINWFNCIQGGYANIVKKHSTSCPTCRTLVLLPESHQLHYTLST
ncbi:interleukin-7 [Platysternon megacephalum]|uniref:Interleukin-7 n=1 Tax=Platysternon megacephalum TaxID=55544 RepID=A0A4D9EZR3_9SAUR|nr:interleukin-7 [Platysternon megacephalum]